MAHRLSPQAELDLDDIWYYIAKQSASIEIANRAIDTITDRLYVIASFPHIGRSREALGLSCRAMPVGEYVIVYRVEGSDVLALRIVHGRRDLHALFGD